MELTLLKVVAGQSTEPLRPSASVVAPISEGLARPEGLGSLRLSSQHPPTAPALQRERRHPHSNIPTKQTVREQETKRILLQSITYPRAVLAHE